MSILTFCTLALVAGTASARAADVGYGWPMPSEQADQQTDFIDLSDAAPASEDEPEEGAAPPPPVYYDPRAAAAPVRRPLRSSNSAVRASTRADNSTIRSQNSAVRQASGGEARGAAQSNNARPKYDRGLSTEDSTLGENLDGKPAGASKTTPTKTAAVQALPGVNGGQDIDYVAVNQPVAQAARELGQAVGLRVVTGSAVQGSVRKRHFKGLFPALMDSLAKEYGLFWFPDGGVIYVEPLADQQTKIVKLKNVSADQLFEAMDLAGLGHVKNRVVAAPGEGSIRVIGPDSFQKVVASLLASLEPAEAPDIKIISYGRRNS